jgi:alginate O-acetyltransferase complex protein AlgI
MTMLVVLVGWILFRCTGDLPRAIAMIQQMATLSDGIAWYPPLAIGAIAVMFLEHLAWRTRLRKAMRLPFDRWYSPVATTIMLWALLIYAPQEFSPFVYFQF